MSLAHLHPDKIIRTIRNTSFRVPVDSTEPSKIMLEVKEKISVMFRTARSLGWLGMKTGTLIDEQSSVEAALAAMHTVQD